MKPIENPRTMLIKFLCCVSGLSLFFISCRNPTAVSSDHQDTIATMQPKSAIEDFDLKQLNSLSPDAALARFGKTTETDQFDLSKSLNEFRIEIYNFIPYEDRSSAKIKIKELSWEYNKEKNLTVWYIYKQDKWQYLHYSLWYKDAKF
jgi:hypothetical protein